MNLKSIIANTLYWGGIVGVARSGIDLTLNGIEGQLSYIGMKLPDYIPFMSNFDWQDPQNLIANSTLIIASTVTSVAAFGIGYVMRKELKDDAAINKGN